MSVNVAGVVRIAPLFHARQYEVVHKCCQEGLRENEESHEQRIVVGVLVDDNAMLI